MGKRPTRAPTFKDIVKKSEAELSVVGRGEPVGEKGLDPLDIGFLTEQAQTWRLARRKPLSKHKVKEVLTDAAVMVFDSFPFGQRVVVPLEDRAAVWAEAESTYLVPADEMEVGGQTHEAYEFRADDDRMLLYLQHWYD
jgi:hypothetical protein